MSYFVYILKSLKDQGYYIGSSSDVQARLRFHNKGLQRSTKSRIPFEVVYVEKCNGKREALIREKQIKSYKGGVAFHKLLNGM
jgi:putative endonuclease